MCGSHTGRMKRRRQFPKESREGTRGAMEVGGVEGRYAHPLPRRGPPFLLLRFLFQRLLENKSAFNNHRDAAAGRNAGGSSVDELGTTTRGASDRQEEGSI